MPKWNDLSIAFNTLREIDVAAIRTEAERPLTIVCVGAVGVCQEIATRLERGTQRYGPIGPSPIQLASLATIIPDELHSVDLIIIGLERTTRLSARELTTIDRLAALALPTVVVVWGTALPADAGPLHPRVAHARLLVVPDPMAPDVDEQLASAILDRLPAELHLAAARRLPGLRATVARQLINNVSFTNASYVLATALPAQIPIFNVPFAAADILVLTKNQAILVYRLALAYGAPPDIRERLREVLPVIGGAFIWRQLARSLVGLIPIWGVAPKVAIAYAGTYTTGMAAWRWFAEGEIIDQARLKELGREALALGRARAADLIAQARRTGAVQVDRWQRWGEALRSRFRRKEK
ncbi:MAG: hypothetical protein KatS3mg055_0798 [Chloroflexus sp.]|uniref:hypothetical protein n=1 Tax=Chloroflexus sp. TaxID=1904827 RepID=UPI0021DE06BE|nr:hypothetical protein [Chloroflexus sp.]GIV88280.1 MAG: hypothetical protein KatS3mg055_0798 [Chloroflexus sp.]